MSKSTVKNSGSGKKKKIQDKDFIDSATWKGMTNEQKKKVLDTRKGKGPPGKTWTKGGNSNSSNTPADILLQKTGGHGTDTRVPQRRTRDAVSEDLLLPGVDPSLDCPIKIDDRALQYLAAGTVLRAIKRGWIAQQLDNNVHPYYAFRYLLDAYRTSVNGTIPQLQQAPKYVWELCYALKPKVENFKTGTISYSAQPVDSLGEGDPAARWVLGPSGEDYVLFWGTTPGSGGDTINGIPVLVAPTTPYTTALGEASIKALWQTFVNTGLCELTADPGVEAWFANDTSAMAATYSELGSSFGASGGHALTVYSERFIDAPMLSKFTQYQDTEFFFRGWHEFRKSAGSAFYLGPRCSEFNLANEMRNKVSPTFLIYNFDSYVEVGALCIGRWLEQMSNCQANLTIPRYPLTSLQFQLILRQSLIGFFNNEMAQDLRYSAMMSSDVFVTMIPLVVGPNGNSLTAQSSNMKMGRFFAEMCRCVKRQVATLKSRFKADSHQVKDLIPILCRPAGEEQLGNYTWLNAVTNAQEDVFAIDPLEQPIELIQCSAVLDSAEVFLDLNGTQINALILAHNGWLTKLNCMTAVTEISSAEPGVAALNCNTYTDIISYVFPQIGAIANANSSANPTVLKKASIPTMKRARVKFNPEFGEPALKGGIQKQGSRAKIRAIGTPLIVKKVGVAPIEGESDYLQKKTALVKVASTFPVLKALWKYSSVMVKPQFFVVAPALQGSYLQYQTVQVQPYTVPVAARENQFSLIGPTPTNPNLFDMHLIAANMDVKTPLETALTEMEIDFGSFQREGKGGFFADIGSVIGGFVDKWF